MSRLARKFVVLLAFLAAAGSSGDGVVLAGEEPGGGAESSPVLTAQLGHRGWLVSVVFSPDGDFVLTTSGDATARLWETASGREIRRFEGHTRNVYSAVFSADGTRVLTASSDGTARLWNTMSGQEIQRFEGHSSDVYSAVFSPDGACVLTGSWDGTARLWETVSGREVRRFEGHSDKVMDVVFSPDGNHVLTASKDRTARLWVTADGTEVRRFEGHSDLVFTAVFSPDASRILTASRDGTARLWETASGREVRSYAGHSEGLYSGVFSPDGDHVLTASRDGTARLWETATGREVVSFEGHPSGVLSAVFSPDGALILTAGWDGIARLWEAATGREIRRFEGNARRVFTAALAPDQAYLLTASWDRTAHLWETSSGREVRRFVGHSEGVYYADFSPDGALVLTSGERTARLWETASGREIRRFEGHADLLNSAVFSPDGGHILTASSDRTARLWDASDGRETQRFEGHSEGLNSAAFSPDGALVLTAGEDGTARLWEAATGQEVRCFEGHSDAVNSAAFSPDGALVLTAGADRTARLWETETGREVRRLEGHSWSVFCAAFSPDGSRILTGDRQAVRLWETSSGREVRRFEGHSSWVFSVRFCPDGAHILTGCDDGTTRLWELETGREICSLISFEDGTWAVTDSDGRFDASHGGDVEGLHWVVGMESISLDQLKARYYDPGLLAKHLGSNPEPLREVAAFDHVELHPGVVLEPPAGERQRLTVHLTNRGGGIGRVVVLVNGKEVLADARGENVSPDAEEATLSIDLVDDPRVRPGETNAVEVLAYNGKGYLRNRGLKVTWEAPGGSAAEPPHLHAIVCGVSDYSGEAIDLRYGDKDAEDFATALRLAATGLFGEDRVHVARLTTSDVEGAVRPTRANLERAFEAAMTARPDDIFVVYLSGHGVNFGGADGDYHFLLADAASADLTDPAVRRATSLSSAELTEWIKRVPASRRQVLILDTCASGRFLERLSEQRRVPASQIRALDRLKDRTGMFVLAGCAADRVSYEATCYGQGLLTYTLLLGMRGAALRENEFVDVGRLFGFSRDRVPALAQDIGGIQQPMVIQPRGGGSFDIGRLTPAVRSQVPLQEAKPIVLRCGFQDERRLRDALRIGPIVEECLRVTPSVIFVDAREMAGAYGISGLYTVTGGRVRVRCVLYRDDREVATFVVEGSANDLEALGAKVAAAATSRIP